MQEFKKIAIIKLSAIGDVVHALPVASALREQYPSAHLTWIVEAKAREIVEGNPDLDEVIVFDKNRWLNQLPYPHKSASVLWDVYRFIHSLRQSGFDLAIDLQGLIKSGLITRLTGASTRLGFCADYCREPANTRFTNRQVTPLSQDVHIIDQCLSLVRHLGAEPGQKQFKIHIPAKDQTYIREFLDKEKVPENMVLLNPGAGWLTKLWDNYADLADRIVSDLGYAVMFLWGPSELSMVKSIRKKMRQPSFQACPTTLKQSMALMQRAHLFVAGDTGPLHLAAALNTPCVGIYGPSSPERNGPYGDIHKVAQADVPCRNCFRRFCSQKTCMKSISVNQIMGLIRQILPLN